MRCAGGLSRGGLILCVILLLALAGASRLPSAEWGAIQPATALSGPQAAIEVQETALASQPLCSGSFVTHRLDVTTSIAEDPVRMFDSNGSGVAGGDLNGDGLLDLAFANLDGPNSVLWNQGGLRFHRQTLDDRSSRAAAIVDVDGDGHQDLVFTHRAGGISHWRNHGDGRLVREALPGVLAPGYSMVWGDLNGDGALDLVTGSYQAELTRERGNAILLQDMGGVNYYEQQSTGFVARRLAPSAQALALALADLDGDGRLDILVGNDFDERDAVWLQRNGDWVAAEPFVATTHSTMSYDIGDIDNDGVAEIFASDMKPYDIRTEVLAAWLPVMATMAEVHAADDPQVMENVLQVRGSDGRWRNQAAARGVDATGWSWSGRLGDLDNDGYLDLYVANGMIAADLFSHLPGNALVEQNQALRNDGAGRFSPAPHWGLGSSASGRGMTLADLDADGDLDAVVNNLGAPAQLFENRLCGGAGLEVDLRWPESRNTHAIGALLVLHTSAGTFYREVRAGSGYLSSDPARVHFGYPSDAALLRLDIRWPDGLVSSLEAPGPQSLLTLTRR